MSDQYSNQEFSDDSSFYSSDMEENVNSENEDSDVYSMEDGEYGYENRIENSEKSPIMEKKIPKIDTSVPKINPWTKQLNTLPITSTTNKSLDDIMKEQVVEEEIWKKQKKERDAVEKVKAAKKKFLLFTQSNNHETQDKPKKSKSIVRRKPKNQIPSK